MRLCFLSSSRALFSPPLPICSFFPKGSRVLLPGLPTSELHYYQQSAFKSAAAQHQDVFWRLILGDTDPSLSPSFFHPRRAWGSWENSLRLTICTYNGDLRPPQSALQWWAACCRWTTRAKRRGGRWCKGRHRGVKCCWAHSGGKKRCLRDS